MPPRRNTNSDDRNLNKDARGNAGNPAGYVNEEGGDNLATPGDQDAPYVIAHGRASADGVTGLETEPNGAMQRLAVDELGRLWAALFVSGAEVGAANPLPVTAGGGALSLMVQGNVAHDAVDVGNPVKVGGRAVAVPTTGFAAVAAGDRTDAAYDLNGRALTVVSGDVANDAVNAGNPVGVGGVAVAAPSGLSAAVAAGDRVSAAFDINGKQLVIPASLSGVKTQLVAAGTAAAAAGAWTSAGVVSLDAGAWRRLRLLLDLDSQAIGNIVGLIVLGAFTAAAPAAGDDEWFALSTTDGTWTSVALAGALPAGQDFSIAPNWLSGTARGSVLQSPATLNVADELRLAFPVVDLAGVRHFQVLYAETGVTATPSQIGLFYALSM